jgi:phosphoserine phosphatase
VPQETLLKMIRAESLNDDTIVLLSAGVQNLVSALAEITGLTDDIQDEPRH